MHITQLGIDVLLQIVAHLDDPKDKFRMAASWSTWLQTSQETMEWWANRSTHIRLASRQAVKTFARFCSTHEITTHEANIMIMNDTEQPVLEGAPVVPIGQRWALGECVREFALSLSGTSKFSIETSIGWPKRMGWMTSLQGLKDLSIITRSDCEIRGAPLHKLTHVTSLMLLGEACHFGPLMLMFEDRTWALPPNLRTFHFHAIAPYHYELFEAISRLEFLEDLIVDHRAYDQQGDIDVFLHNATCLENLPIKRLALSFPAVSHLPATIEHFEVINSHAAHNEDFCDFLNTSNQAGNSHLKSANFSNIGMDIVPSEFRVFTNLQSLNLSKNQVSSFDQRLSNLVNLKHLNLTSCSLTRVPESITVFANLRNLILRDNPDLSHYNYDIDYEVLESYGIPHTHSLDPLEALPNLVYVDLRECGFMSMPANLPRIGFEMD